MKLTVSLLIFDSTVPWFAERFLVQISVRIRRKNKMHYEKNL